MTDANTQPRAESETWLQCVLETYHELAQSGHSPKQEELCQVLSSRLSLQQPLLAAWMKGAETLAQLVHAPESLCDAMEEEKQSLEVAMSAACPLLEARLQLQLDRLDAQEQNKKVLCEQCGQKMGSEGRRTRPWQSTLGRLELKRRYVLCGPCSQGLAPSQRPLGLPDGPYTGRLEEVCSLMTTTLPHALAEKTLKELLLLDVGETGLKHLTARRASKVIEQDDGKAEQLNPFDEMGLSRQLERPPDAVEEVPEVAYLEMDGVFAMTRQEKPLSPKQLAEVPKGARGGKGRKYEMEGKEIKNAVLYNGNDCVGLGEQRGSLLEKTYVSHLGNWKPFALLVWAQITRLRFDEAATFVVLSDGAEWIRSLCEWLPVEVLLILDLFHVKKRIWEMAKVLYPSDAKKEKRWARTQLERVEDGHAQKVIESLRFLKPESEKVKEKIEELKTYLKNNLDRMNYPEYRARGLRVGSGVVESTNYHVTGARLKLQGMRWSEQGAAEMARLRADLFNGVWEERTRQILRVA